MDGVTMSCQAEMGVLKPKVTQARAHMAQKLGRRAQARAGARPKTKETANQGEGQLGNQGQEQIQMQSRKETKGPRAGQDCQVVEALPDGGGQSFLRRPVLWPPPGL